ncbi:MAG: hypothetical protein KKA54_02475 [Proteobacteria bacterium]|nr:hypothetical protein [Pseudomonadota bacterium]
MNKIESFFTEYKNTITILSGLFVVCGFFIAATDYINSQIEKKITEDTYINKLSKELRPFSIFDVNGVMQYDHGGEKYIEKMEVVHGSQDDIKSVKIYSKIFLQNAPILNYTGLDTYAYKSHRVDTHVWEYKFGSYDLLTMNPKDFEKMEPILMVEILK